MPKVSVITITYNRAKFLPEAIESVLAQTFTDWELLIVDDMSKDNTEEVVKKYSVKDSRVKYFKNEVNLGMTKNRNYGIGLASGKYIAMLDSDDLWCDNDKLKKQFDFLENNPEYTLIGGGVIVINGDGSEKERYLHPESDADIRKQMLLKNPFSNSSVLFLKQAVVDAGLYNESPLSLEDYDLWLRLGIKWKFHNLPDYVLKYRVHGNNISIIEREKYIRNNLRVIGLYKKNYPNYRMAVLRRTFRLWGYKIVSKVIKS